MENAKPTQKNTTKLNTTQKHIEKHKKNKKNKQSGVQMGFLLKTTNNHSAQGDF